MKSNINWDHAAFFERLTKANKLAQEKNFVFARVSSLEGFRELLAPMVNSRSYIAASDVSQGHIELNNTPHTRRVKLVFIAMRHKEGDMKAREKCLDTMREIFRQFMTKLILEKTILEENNLYLDDQVSFTEVDKYFATGYACAFFQIALDTYTDLVYNPDEWQTTTQL